MINEDLQKIIALAIKKAARAARNGEIPVAAVIFDKNTDQVIAHAVNSNGKYGNATHHAEMLAIAKASRKLRSRYLSNCGIFVTLEPCPMCAVAISYAKMPLLLFGAEDEKGGGIWHGARVYETQKNLFIPKVRGGIEQECCGRMLTDFFRKMRKEKHNERS